MAAYLADNAVPFSTNVVADTVVADTEVNTGEEVTLMTGADGVPPVVMFVPG